MLIEKKFNIGDVVSLKLISGEEIMGRLIEQTLTDYCLENPTTIAMAPTGGVALLPFMMGLEEKSKIDIRQVNVMAISKTRKELTNAFIEQTTGLQTTSGGFDPNAQKPTASAGGGRGARGGLVHS